MIYESLIDVKVVMDSLVGVEVLSATAECGVSVSIPRSGEVLLDVAVRKFPVMEWIERWETS